MLKKRKKQTNKQTNKQKTHCTDKVITVNDQQTNDNDENEASSDHNAITAKENGGRCSKYRSNKETN